MVFSPYPQDMVRPARYLAAWTAMLTVITAACASSSEPDTAPTPQLTERSVRISGTGEYGMTIFNEPGVAARTVGVPWRLVWGALEDAYTEMEVEVTYADPTTRHMGNNGYRVRRIEGQRISTYLDCGMGLTGPNADNYDVTLSIMTRLDPVAGDSTRIETTVDGSAKARATSGNSVHCRSKGELELRVAAHIQTMLLGEDPPG
jgi:hypothetical protein